MRKTERLQVVQDDHVESTTYRYMNRLLTVTCSLSLSESLEASRPVL